MRLVLEKIISNGLYKYLLFDNFQIEKVNTLDIEKIKSYYNQIRSEDLCDCDYCRNNIQEVKAAYSTFFIGTHPITEFRNVNWQILWCASQRKLGMYKRSLTSHP